MDSASCPRCYSPGDVSGTEATCSVCDNTWGVDGTGDERDVARTTRAEHSAGSVHEAVDGSPGRTCVDVLGQRVHDGSVRGKDGRR